MRIERKKCGNCVKERIDSKGEIRRCVRHRVFESSAQQIVTIVTISEDNEEEEKEISRKRAPEVIDLEKEEEMVSTLRGKRPEEYKRAEDRQRCIENSNVRIEVPKKLFPSRTSRGYDNFPLSQRLINKHYEEPYYSTLAYREHYPCLWGIPTANAYLNASGEFTSKWFGFVRSPVLVEAWRNWNFDYKLCVHPIPEWLHKTAVVLKDKYGVPAIIEPSRNLQIQELYANNLATIRGHSDDIIGVPGTGDIESQDGLTHLKCSYCHLFPRDPVHCLAEGTKTLPRHIACYDCVIKGLNTMERSKCCIVNDLQCDGTDNAKCKSTFRRRSEGYNLLPEATLRELKTTRVECNECTLVSSVWRIAIHRKDNHTLLKEIEKDVTTVPEYDTDDDETNPKKQVTMAELNIKDAVIRNKWRPSDVQIPNRNNNSTVKKSKNGKKQKSAGKTVTSVTQSKSSVPSGVTPLPVISEKDRRAAGPSKSKKIVIVENIEVVPDITAFENIEDDVIPMNNSGNASNVVNKEKTDSKGINDINSSSSGSQDGRDMQELLTINNEKLNKGNTTMRKLTNKVTRFHAALNISHQVIGNEYRRFDREFKEKIGEYDREVERLNAEIEKRDTMIIDFTQRIGKEKEENNKLKEHQKVLVSDHAVTAETIEKLRVSEKQSKEESKEMTQICQNMQEERDEAVTEKETLLKRNQELQNTINKMEEFGRARVQLPAIEIQEGSQSRLYDNGRAVPEEVATQESVLESQDTVAVIKSKPQKVVVRTPAQKKAFPNKRNATSFFKNQKGKSYTAMSTTPRQSPRPGIQRTLVELPPAMMGTERELKEQQRLQEEAQKAKEDKEFFKRKNRELGEAENRKRQKTGKDSREVSRKRSAVKGPEELLKKKLWKEEYSKINFNELF